MQKGIHIKSDGTEIAVKPKDGKAYSLEELQAFVGGTMDLRTVMFEKKECYMVFNDDGLLLKLPTNEKATKIWVENRPLTPSRIVGDVLIAPKKYIP